MKRSRKRIVISFNSPVILSFTAICFAALILDFITKGATTNTFFSVYRSSLLSPWTYVRFIGHIFGHAGWEHFIGNIMMILVVGPLLEEKYGSSSISPKTAAGSQRRCFRLYLARLFHQPAGRGNPSYLHTCGTDLYGRTDLRGNLYPR